MYICDQIWPSEELKRGYFLGVIVLTCYTVPLLFITVFYTLIACKVWNRDAPGNSANSSEVIHRSKIRVLKMLIVVVIMFAFCWLPLYVVNIRLFFGPPMEFPSREFDLLTQTIVPLAQWLGLSSCSVNPIVYCLFSGKFRAGYRSLLASVPCCGRRCSGALANLSRSSSPTMAAYSRTFRNIGHGVVTDREFNNHIDRNRSGSVSSQQGRVSYGSTRPVAGGPTVAVHVIAKQEAAGRNGCGVSGGGCGRVRYFTGERHRLQGQLAVQHTVGMGDHIDQTMV